MEQVTPNVITETQLRGCNPSYVVTSAGVVLIDTPQLPTKAVAWRKEAESHGRICYLINTEHHVDHIFGNYYFKGAGEVVQHQGVFDNFMVVFPDLDPFAYAAEAIPTDDPEGAAILPGRDEFYADLNRGNVVFDRDLTLRLGITPSTCSIPLATPRARWPCTYPRNGSSLLVTPCSPNARRG